MLCNVLRLLLSVVRLLCALYHSPCDLVFRYMIYWLSDSRIKLHTCRRSFALMMYLMFPSASKSGSHDSALSLRLLISVSVSCFIFLNYWINFNVNI